MIICSRDRHVEQSASMKLLTVRAAKSAALYSINLKAPP
ncbi:hypothetical protein BTN50_0619 [Candidatus Enterovibrio altilux]|uniref:Uncharacterized protein n=1 Tax=Candidatus Enterovibrio altilux TaxID=1927128 RepID=A0A291B811_9GAMM|nr:hypothetical protein BTN50_0619 [Candidatus Enterovibrio luxaltus]